MNILSPAPFILDTHFNKSEFDARIKAAGKASVSFNNKTYVLWKANLGLIVEYNTSESDMQAFRGALRFAICGDADTYAQMLDDSGPAGWVSCIHRDEVDRQSLEEMETRASNFRASLESRVKELAGRVATSYNERDSRNDDNKKEGPILENMLDTVIRELSGQPGGALRNWEADWLKRHVWRPLYDKTKEVGDKPLSTALQSGSPSVQSLPGTGGKVGHLLPPNVRPDPDGNTKKGSYVSFPSPPAPEID